MATRENKTVTLPAHIRVRRDTLANWTSINPVLDDGELAIVRMPDGSITMRVGTGADSFKNLPDISNSGADEIHILDSATGKQPSGTLSTSDYELCINNHVIGVKSDNTENAQVILFYKLAEYLGNCVFGVVLEGTVTTVTVLASKQYSITETVIPDSLEVSGNTVKMNDTETGVTFDLAKDASGKVQITLNGIAVGTGITVPDINKGKLLDYDGNEIFNADQSDDVKVILFDCGGAEFPNIDDLIAMSAANNVDENLVGLAVPIKIDGKDVLFRISDVNTYDLSDGSGKSHYTLEMVGVLDDRRMVTDRNTGG